MLLAPAGSLGAGIDLTDPVLQQLTLNLSPGQLRVGGTAMDSTWCGAAPRRACCGACCALRASPLQCSHPCPRGGAWSAAVRPQPNPGTSRINRPATGRRPTLGHPTSTPSRHRGIRASFRRHATFAVPRTLRRQKIFRPHDGLSAVDSSAPAASLSPGRSPFSTAAYGAKLRTLRWPPRSARAVRPRSPPAVRFAYFPSRKPLSHLADGPFVWPQRRRLSASAMQPVQTPRPAPRALASSPAPPVSAAHTRFKPVRCPSPPGAAMAGTRLATPPPSSPTRWQPTSRWRAGSWAMSRICGRSATA